LLRDFFARMPSHQTIVKCDERGRNREDVEYYDKLNTAGWKGDSKTDKRGEKGGPE